MTLPYWNSFNTLRTDEPVILDGESALGIPPPDIGVEIHWHHSDKNLIKNIALCGILHINNNYW